MSTSDREAANLELRKTELVWEEYRYRHDLIWRVTFQITAASVALAIVPYVNRDLGIVVLVPPILAVALTGVGLLVLEIERRLFLTVRDRYRELQETNLGVDQGQQERKFLDSKLGKKLQRFSHILGYDDQRGTAFSNPHVHFVIYLWILLLLNVVNFLYVATVWFPGADAP